MLTSKIKLIGDVEFPATFKQRELSMYPINIHDFTLPELFLDFKAAVDKMLSSVNIENPIVYLTIDQRMVAKGTTHRKAGAHVDGNYIIPVDDKVSRWPGGGGGGWKVGNNGGILSPELHQLHYAAPTGGMIITSSYQACKVWEGIYNGIPARGGDCSSLDLSNLTSSFLMPGKVYLANSTCIHESVPVEETVGRTLIRITLDHKEKV